MKYTVDRDRVADNHRRFAERQELYKSRGLDHLAHRRRLLDWAGQLGEHILEMGSGRGYLTITMAGAGYRFVSVDRDHEMADTTILNLTHEGTLGQVEICLGDARTLPFSGGAFDTVIAVDFFHHADDREIIVAEIDRVLKPEGRAVISDFNRRGRDILNAIHEAEGRSHPEALPAASMEAPFAALGYRIEGGEDDSHWFFKAAKPED